MKTKLSVNINKIATLRNARGGNMPDVLKVAKDIQLYGAEGITVHPRPDERHIRYQDVRELKTLISTEFNIEGYPSEKFIELVLEVSPTQVTLVPDPPEALTSNNGWDTKKYGRELSLIIQKFHQQGIRTSIFVNPDEEMIAYAKDTLTDRIELYTESYASNYMIDKQKAIAPFVKAAVKATQLELGINAGHDLSLVNLAFFAQQIPQLMEVSIGHALICDALYLGLEKTIHNYLQLLQ